MNESKVSNQNVPVVQICFQFQGNQVCFALVDSKWVDSLMTVWSSFTNGLWTKNNKNLSSHESIVYVVCQFFHY